MEGRQHQQWPWVGNYPRWDETRKKSTTSPPQSHCCQGDATTNGFGADSHIRWLGRFFVGLTSNPSDFLDILA